MKKSYAYILRTTLATTMAIVLITACGNKNGTTVETDNSADSLAVVEEVKKEVAPPAFAFCSGKDFIEIVYWTNPNYGELDLPDPENEENKELRENVLKSWRLQEAIRTHAQEYDQMVVNGKLIPVSYSHELLLTPDSTEAPLGQWRSHFYPTKGLVYKYGNDADKPKDQYYANTGILVSNDFLKTAKILPIKNKEGAKLPAKVVSQLEKKYGMTAQSSQLVTVIGDIYQYGVMQFKPKNGKLLALNVMIAGDSIAVNEDEGYISEDGDMGWNVDDDGEYYPCWIIGAFETPEGVKMYYSRYAPESHEIGVFTINGDKLSRDVIDMFYVYPEGNYTKPLWRSEAKFKTIIEGADTEEPIIRVKVYDAEGSEQQLLITKLEWAPNSMVDLGNVVEADINFDGHKDVMVFTGCYGIGAGVAHYEAWCWSPYENIFTAVEGFGDICNPELYPEEKYILGTNKDGRSVEYSRYEWEGGSTLKCVKTWEEDLSKIVE